jgi:anti-sigma B factor antagonist
MPADGEQSVIRVAGDMDVVTVPKFLTLVAAAVSRPGTRTLVLDLSGVDFMDSTGVGALLQTRSLCNERRAELKLLSVGRPVRRALSLSGLTRTFGVPDSDRSSPS